MAEEAKVEIDTEQIKESIEAQIAQDGTPRKIVDNGRLTKFIILMVGFIGALTLFISSSAFIFMLLSLIPAIFLTIFSTKKGSSFFNTIVCFNISGLIPYMAKIFDNPDRAGAVANAMMKDPIVLLYVYTATMIGWIVVTGLPQLLGIFYSVKAELRINEYRRQQQHLLQEWSDQIKKTNYEYM